jgi:hypothetical protein
LYISRIAGLIKRKFFVFSFFLPSFFCFADFREITTAEYFIGTDPGEGNGTSLSPHDGSFSHSLETILDTNLSVNSLSLGTHILNIRYKDDNGTWGEILKHPFTVFDPAPDLNRSNSSGNYNLQGIHNLAAAEYFIGTDPGEGNGTSLSPHDGSFSHSVESIVETQISVHGLSLGIHQIGIRYKDDNGTWGEVLKNLFKIEAFTGNYHPTNLILNGNSIFENQPAGSTVGTFSATDPDGNGSLTYSLIDSNSSSLSNHRFLLEANGTLKTESLFDYESNNSYSIRVQAKDEENATTEGNFTILITNIIEDLDGDGSEDHFDHDDDNDGFSDAEEIAFGSDPRDDNSIANSHPRDLNTTSLLAFYENFPIGTFVGQFSAVDPDPHAILTFSLTSGFRDNDLFRMESNGTLRTASFFDFETNNSVPHSFLIEASVRDQYGYKADGNFTISLLNINEPPFDLNASAPIQVLENQPAGLKVAQFSAQDPDTPTTLTYNLVGRANHNQFFSIDHNGTIRTVVPLDYEANASLTIRIKVRDQHNAWVKQDFTVQVVNEVEDFDGDGIEDAYDPDNDNDGFSNAEEIAYGSNPWDAKSIANASPTDLTLSNPTILGNQPAGTIVGQLIGSDPDANSTLDYSRVLGPGDQHNSYFMIDQNQSLRTTKSFDYESDDHNLSVRIRVRDEHNASLVKVFTIALLDMNDTVVPPTTDHNQTQPTGDGNETISPDHNQSIAPIVQTGNFSTDGNGTYRFEGKILSGEYANILEAGILIKPADSNDSQLLHTDLNGTGGIIRVSTKSLNGGKTYFYRAYALTTEGESLGTIRRIEVSYRNDTRYWWSSITSARTDGWIIDSWMGDLLPYPNQWAYHRRLGWIFMSPDGNQGYWLWRQENGWLWTNSSTWPFLWSHQSTGWHYLLPVKNQALFYDYGNGSLK